MLNVGFYPLWTPLDLFSHKAQHNTKISVTRELDHRKALLAQLDRATDF